MDRRRKRIIAFLQQEGGRGGRGGRGVRRPRRRSGSDRAERSIQFCLPRLRWCCGRCRGIRSPASKSGGGDRSGRRARDQVATRRRRFVCFLRSLPYRIGAQWCMGLSSPSLLLLRPFQSLRVDVKIAPSPLELAPMEPIGRPDDELRLREGGEVYR